MAEKLSNVIGAPFDKYILDQLYIRAARNSTVQRSNEEVLFLANKTGWARLISSVNIVANQQTQAAQSVLSVLKFYENLGLPTSVYNTPEALAKNWILEAGTSIGQQGQSIKLRSGFGPDGAYGLGGTEELGYRPMPGLTSVQVETVGRLGSLRQATISFKVWNMDQLNVVEALYFRLGYSMLLEWGHTQFFVNPSTNNGNPGGTFTVATNTFGLDDPFASGTNKTTVQQKIAKKSKELSGNYDGMLGIVSNFNWSFNQEGGYDCTVKLIGLGSIIDTIRINQSYKMPQGLIESYKKAQQSIQDEQERKRKKAEQEKINQQKQAEEERIKKQNAGLIPVPKNSDELYQAAVQSGYKEPETNFFEQSTYWPAYQIDPNAVNTVPDYFYLSTGVDKETDNQKTFGLFSQGGGTRWAVLHQSYGSRFGGRGSTFKMNIPLFESITGEYLKGLSDTQKQIVNTSNYRSNVTKLFQTKQFNINNISTGKLSDLVLYERKIIDEKSIKGFRIEITIKIEGADYLPNVEQLYAIFESWTTPNATDEKSNLLYLTNFEEDKDVLRKAIYDDLFITAETPTYVIKDVPYSGTSRVTAQTKPFADVKAWIEFRFDNTALVGEIGPSIPTNNPTAQAPEKANTGDTTAADNSATNTQTDPANAYESALHVMLSYVKTVALAKLKNANYTDVPVVPLDIVDATKSFYQDGILKDVFNILPALDTFNKSPFNVTYYAQKGFNSNLLVDALANQSLFTETPTVDFTKLCKAYLVQYQISNYNSDETNYPVYISLGYLLAFLNNMCLVYDSKQVTGTDRTLGNPDKAPYVFIDFNPDTNFCLSSPQHLSIDPTVCLIPFQGGDEGYKKIFPPEVVSSIPGLFTPSTNDFLSGQIPEFKSQTGNAYQGKTMNILLNIDFITKVANSFANSDSEHSVNLKGFLEAIMVEVNKSLGNQNLFRVAYRDDSNTVQIKDDQWVPNLPGELNILAGTQQSRTDVRRLGELPVFEQKSLARTFQFKTNVSTKLGSMIAISAQAATGSINATDPSSFSYLNKNYQDRFKPYVVDASTSPNAGKVGNKVVEVKPNDKTNNDLNVAEQLNTLVKSIYENFNLDLGKIDTGKNYYIERISKTKSNDPITTAAPFIPADLEITIDGIAGILMGNAFTIPESRLPLSLRGENGLPKVGFVVAGLVHTIQENQWLTKIRGQMIKLREVSSYSSVVEVNKIQGQLKRISSSGTRELVGVGAGCTRVNSIALQNAGTGFELLKKILTNNGLNSSIALASILAIVGGESNWEGNKEEDFRYSAGRLAEVFPGLTADQAQRAVAAKTRREFFSIVYGEYNPSRIGNRNIQDGGLYYGRGFIQLTGYGNYKKYGDIIGRDLVNNPDLAADPNIAAQIVVAYIKDRVKKDINDPTYFQTAVYAVGNPVDPEVKVGYYNCLIGKV
jgi:predicted chitinase